MSQVWTLPPTLSVLEGRNVRLRRFGAVDIGDSYLDWLNDPDVVRYSNQRLRKHDKASSEQYLASFADTDNLFVAIEDKASGQLLGTMTAYVSRHHGTVDVGLMVGERSAWGSGVGQDAWNTLCNWLLGAEVGLRKLTAGAARPNVAMVRIMERSGMQLEAVRCAQEIIEGEPVDLVYYARFASHA